MIRNHPEDDKQHRQKARFGTCSISPCAIVCQRTDNEPNQAVRQVARVRKSAQRETEISKRSREQQTGDDGGEAG